ncbi:uncharacterized protein LOC121178697 isoform X2 [Toxotes jaculatrix]|uniref:uncharacterized protein LOC121178697 isoform X2 n=1 Tax=Toxotes jaculatrix TaxID=941984 RepID=UPI001B3ABFA5|nr:uncharacterized protein LOC121178697 isoform X2 [Toxotes jaculatrix]
MSNTGLQGFRSFITERFTAVAVEILAEVETLVDAYYEENKRLRNVLHMVLNPEIKLPRIDVNEYTKTTTDVREQPSEPNTEVDVAMSEPLPKKPKEEQIEWDISCGSEQLEEQGGADNTVTTDYVKNDPDEEEINLSCITDLYRIQVVDYNPTPSATFSAEEVNDEREDSCSLDSDTVTDCPQSRSEESASEEPQKHKKMSKKSKKCLQKTMVELPRMVPYKSAIAAPTDCQSFLARLTEAFKDVPDDKKPLITKMGLTADVELVDCTFGKVPKGCPLSYQCPVPLSKDYNTHEDAPPRPLLPLSYHKLKPMSALPTLSAKEQEHVSAMQVTWEAAYSLELSTRGCKKSAEQQRKLRLTSHVRDICKLKPGRGYAEHLICKIRKEFSRCKRAMTEEEMKTEALQKYCQHLCVNWSPSGFVVHPNAPWFGVLPDGVVYDPNEKRSFGLVHVKCISSRSFIDCGFLVCREGVLKLKTTHSYYWHIQAEMMVTGTSWCDLFVFSREDILVQRIYRDKAIMKVMKKKLPDFFFHYYLPSLVYTAVKA